jgi:hypothetical protein
MFVNGHSAKSKEPALHHLTWFHSKPRWRSRVCRPPRPNSTLCDVCWRIGRFTCLGRVVFYTFSWTGRTTGPRIGRGNRRTTFLSPQKGGCVFLFALAHWQVLCKAHLYAKPKARSGLQYRRQHPAGAGQERAGREAPRPQRHHRRRSACFQLDLPRHGGRRRQKSTCPSF